MTDQYVYQPADHRRLALNSAVTLHGTGAAPDVVLKTAHEFLAFVTGGSQDAKAPTPTGRKRAAATPATGTSTAPPAAAPAQSEVTELDTEESAGFLDDVVESPPPAPQAAPKVYKLEEVRSALLALQQRTNAKTAREVLAKSSNGADTLGKLKPEQFAAVVDAATNYKAA